MKALLTSLVCVFLAAPAAFAQHAGHPGMDEGDAAQASGSGASDRMMQAMKAMNATMDQSPMTGKPGVDFARMMIPHHQSAIEMAKAYLDSGETDPVLTRISREVISSQEDEIAELRAWLDENAGK